MIYMSIFYYSPIHPLITKKACKNHDFIRNRFRKTNGFLAQRGMHHIMHSAPSQPFEVGLMIHLSCYYTCMIHTHTYTHGICRNLDSFIVDSIGLESDSLVKIFTSNVRIYSLLQALHHLIGLHHQQLIIKIKKKSLDGENSDNFLMDSLVVDVIISLRCGQGSRGTSDPIS